jgi:hypothetical protein
LRPCLIEQDAGSSQLMMARRCSRDAASDFFKQIELHRELINLAFERHDLHGPHLREVTERFHLVRTQSERN